MSIGKVAWKKDLIPCCGRSVWLKVRGMLRWDVSGRRNWRVKTLQIESLEQGGEPAQ